MNEFAVRYKRDADRPVHVNSTCPICDYFNDVTTKSVNSTKSSNIDRCVHFVKCSDGNMIYRRKFLCPGSDECEAVDMWCDWVPGKEPEMLRGCRHRKPHDHKDDCDEVVSFDLCPTCEEFVFPLDKVAESV